MASDLRNQQRSSCDYCFENKVPVNLSHEGLAVIIDKILIHMDLQDFTTLVIYWQGGEVMTLPPEWYEKARDIIAAAARKNNKKIE